MKHLTSSRRSRIYCSVLGHSALQLRVSQGALSALGGTHESNDPSSAAFCKSVSAGRGQHEHEKHVGGWYRTSWLNLVAVRLLCAAEA
jgi:hypothetical protein